ncbi:DNA repair protein RecN [Bifidobacterium cuniculi]|uniref:DNA repair protein RecN n=1 Tax=Bifidobacterium cuniculi TaxID=1688 RepID=A0A087AQC8_9BIFI|nr:DNA repair protein RecN [Bifidobacterium cuniculi]KFI60978.1 DNA repair protein RecN [Bifidobacterium cuniculi]
MLEELEVHDLGPIHEARLEPAVGMTAITGETGAGKSMLLNAIRLISGNAADAARVSPGADAAWAQGVFAVGQDPILEGVLEEAGVEVQDGELFVSRRVPAKGRSRAVACGRTVPRAVLAELSRRLITIHGQSDQLHIASAARQREVLDGYAQDDAEREAYAHAWQELRDIEGRLERLERQEAGMRQQADYLTESIARIDRVDPHADELDELKARRDRIEHAAQIAEGVQRAVLALDGSGEGDLPGVADKVGDAVHALRAIRLDGMFDEDIARLEAAAEEIRDVSYSLASHIDDEVGERDLDTINGRIHDLDELARRWGPTLRDVIAWRDQARFDLEDLDASPEKMAELQTLRTKALDRARRAAAVLSKARMAAAKTLSGAVDGELGNLSMPGASFHVDVHPRQGADALDAHGCDDIAFMFRPFPNAKPMPMARSASGGELSRLMLAMELSLAARDTADGDRTPMTFIFDEVDAGVGGVAGAELGHRLAMLATHAQVIVVTHLPQVASWADVQYVVGKADEAGFTRTHVRQVDGDERAMEIARMLSGSDSETSLDHARELLASSTLAKEGQ